MTEIQIAMLLIFVTSAVALYALIEARKNYFMLFIFTPVLLVSSIFAGNVLYSLQGTPIPGIPQEEVEVVWVEMAKPDILFLARSTEEGGHPKYYKIAYTEKNRKKMNQIMEAVQSGQNPTGQFKIVSGGSTEGGEDIEFNLPNLPPEEPKASPPVGVQSGYFGGF